MADITGVPFDEDDPEAAVDRLGNLSRLIGATLRDTANVTMFDAGYKANVVPSVAAATVDGRILPGREDAFERELVEVLGPDVEREWDSLPPVETTFDGRWSTRWRWRSAPRTPARGSCPTCCRRAPTPSRSTASASATSASPRCGCRPTWTSRAMFHGVDERVPIDALEFGTARARPLPPQLLTRLFVRPVRQPDSGASNSSSTNGKSR